MGVLKYKILHDLWENWDRTLRVVLIIAIGSAALGMIVTTRNLMIPGMQTMWRAIDPAMLTLYVGPNIDDESLFVLKREDGVQKIEGFVTTTIEWRLSPQDEWKSGGLTARADYDQQQLNKLELVSGAWPEEEKIATERGADTFFGIPPGGTVYLRIDKKDYQLQLGGIVYNQLSQPAYLGGNAQFYSTREQFERMVGTRDYNRILVSAPQYEEQAMQELGDRLQAKLEKQGRGSFRVITDPNKHFFQDQMDGLFFLLGVLGALSLVLGLLLVYTTITAVISQQVDQIGIMKAIGAGTGQILRVYLLTVLVYGLLALIIALPLGVLGGWGITTWLSNNFGADMGAFEVSPQAIILMSAICLLAPLLASLAPIASGVRITVREAINTYGLSTNTGLIERLLAKVRFISRLVLIAISNTFQHKWRVVLLQISLVISGLIFMMVVSVRDSVEYTIRDVMFSILGADATYVFERGQRIDYIEDLTRTHPAVADAEAWGLANAKIRPRGQPSTEDDENTTLLGVPLPTHLYGYQLRGGRWLEPQDGYAIVLNSKLADEIGVGVGDWVTMKYGEKNERDWQVVGLVFDPILFDSANVPRDLLLRDLASVGRVGTMWVKLKSQDPASQISTAKALRTFYEDHHIEVAPQRGVFNIGGDATVETANTFINQFNFLVILLGLMAVIIALVGSIALGGSLSLSVMERTREIGVMRAIGASSWAVARLFINEGLILGWLSWLIALPLSLPAGRVMVQALGAAFNLDIVYRYTLRGAVLWLVIITFLAILASWLPARSATRVSVRESLAYQ